MKNPFPIVAMLGRRLEGERTGWRDMKGLVLMVAQGGPEAEAWPIASDLAAALGLDEEQQENIYRNAYGGERPATTTAQEGISHADEDPQARVRGQRDHVAGYPHGGRDRDRVGGEQREDPHPRVPAYPGFR